MDATINHVAKRHYDWVESAGWHNKSALECLALIASEVGESVNECRGAKPSPKLGEELSDIILRTLDLMLVCGFDPEVELLSKIRRNAERGNRGRVF